MSDLLSATVPLAIFMFIPVWIPVIGVAVGAVLDRVRAVPLTPAEEVVSAAKERSARTRQGLRSAIA